MACCFSQNCCLDRAHPQTALVFGEVDARPSLLGHCSPQLGITTPGGGCRPDARTVSKVVEQSLGCGPECQLIFGKFKIHRRQFVTAVLLSLIRHYIRDISGDTDGSTRLSFETIRYEVDGHVCTITLDRPKQANAQNSLMLDELDAAFDKADIDDDIRVVILAGAGKHFSAGHDLKEILGGTDDWARLRDTPEGKLRHEQVMYFDRCVRIRDFRKPTIAAVQGACTAAGLMLACMCDLIVAADDAVFSNPVLRMTGAGVELLVEPWELGPRKAKEFLWCAEKLDAQEAWRLGMVNRVAPAEQLMTTTREMADKVALVPPITAQMVKDTVNHSVDLAGQRESWRYHFMVHQFVSNTETALSAAQIRKQGSMTDVIAEQQRGSD